MTKTNDRLRENKVQKMLGRFVEVFSMCRSCAKKHRAKVVDRSYDYTCPTCNRNGKIVYNCYFSS